jgi:hypothetical protein
MKLVDALSKSLVIIPVVSSDALQKMIALKSTDEDNLLIEWICGLELIKHRQNNPGSSSRLMKFMPIFFGTRIDENNIQNFFQENICSKLSTTTRPTACLGLAKNLLLKAGITMSDEMSKATINDIVTEVTKYLFLCAWESKSFHQLTIQAAKKIVGNINECLSQEQLSHKVQTPKSSGFDEQSPKASSSSAAALSALPNAIDYEAVWALLQPKKSTNPEALSALLEELCVEGPDDVRYLLKKKESLEQVDNLLKEIPQMKLREILKSNS